MSLIKGRIFVPAEKFDGPLPRKVASYRTVLRDHWWITNADGHLLFYRDFGGNSGTLWSPQANPSQRVSEILCAKLYPDLEVRWVYEVVVPRNQDGSHPILPEYCNVKPEEAV